MFELSICNVYWKELPGFNMPQYLHEEWNPCRLYKMKLGNEISMYMYIYHVDSYGLPSHRLKDNKETTHSFSLSLVDKLLDGIMILRGEERMARNHASFSVTFLCLVIENLINDCTTWKYNITCIKRIKK